jgi:hypothetical protein
MCTKYKRLKCKMSTKTQLYVYEDSRLSQVLSGSQHRTVRGFIGPCGWFLRITWRGIMSEPVVHTHHMISTALFSIHLANKIKPYFSDEFNMITDKVCCK